MPTSTTVVFMLRINTAASNPRSDVPAVRSYRALELVNAAWKHFNCGFAQSVYSLTASIASLTARSFRWVSCTRASNGQSAESGYSPCAVPRPSQWSVSTHTFPNAQNLAQMAYSVHDQPDTQKYKPALALMEFLLTELKLLDGKKCTLWSTEYTGEWAIWRRQRYDMHACLGSSFTLTNPLLPRLH